MRGLPQLQRGGKQPKTKSGNGVHMYGNEDNDHPFACLVVETRLVYDVHQEQTVLVRVFFVLCSTANFTLALSCVRGHMIQNSNLFSPETTHPRTPSETNRSRAALQPSS